MKNIAAILLLIAISFSTKAQNYSILAIPNNLKTDAVAVIRHSSQEFRQYDVNTGIYTACIVITILNDDGIHHAEFTAYENSFRELKKFSGEFFNAFGKSVQRISKKDLHTTGYSHDLATDSKLIYYQHHSPVYPFTVKYTYSIELKNGILMYPSFMPVASTGVSVEHASYRLQTPGDNKVRYKLQGNIAPPEKSSQGKDSVFNFTIDHLKAYRPEPYASYSDLYPCARLSPAKFCAHEVCGDLSTWEGLGKWQEQLLDGRDGLPPEVVAKVNELTGNATDTIEKVKRIYEYLQNSTRYVSIQLGIGGWQPMPAAEVAKTGFGDCKALSNYMKALLSAVGIPSCYVVISTQKEKLFRDHPDFGQANHVILMVPMQRDSVWLECTSQTLPFGYIHENIAGHDALAIGNDSIFFCTVPAYPDSVNKTINNINIVLQSDGWADMQIHSSYYMREYENMAFRINGLSANEENNLLAKRLQIIKPLIQHIRKEESKDNRPQLDLYYTVRCEDYTQSTRTRLVAPLFPIQTQGIRDFTSPTRTTTIKLDQSIYQTDSITMYIPDGYIAETLPAPVNITTDYGSYSFTINLAGNRIHYTRITNIKQGLYTVDQYDAIKQFFKQVNEQKFKTIIFQKNT